MNTIRSSFAFFGAIFLSMMFLPGATFAQEREADAAKEVAERTELLTIEEVEIVTPTAENLLKSSTDTTIAILSPLTNEELEGLAYDIQAIARTRTQDAVNLSFIKPDPEDPGIQAEDFERIQSEFEQELVEKIERRRLAFARLDLVLDEWERKGGEADKIEELRKYREAIEQVTREALSVGSLFALARAWMISPDGGQEFLLRAAILLGIIVFLFFISKIISLIIAWHIKSHHTQSQLFITFVSFVSFWVIMLFGIALALVLLGVEITPVLALFGGASFVLAFALQETLGNLFAGVMIMLNRPFDLNERIESNGMIGHVVSLSLSSTILRTADNQLVTIPNAKVWNDVIVNSSDLPSRRIDLEFQVVRPDQAVAAIGPIMQLLSARDDVLNDPQSGVYIANYDGKGAALQVRPWVNSGNYWNAKRAISQELALYFEDNAIELWRPHE